MIGTYRLVARFDAQSGLPEDQIQNVFHFDGLDASSHALVMTNLGVRVTNFYNTVHTPPINSVASYMARLVKRTPLAARFSLYFRANLLPGGTWGSPVQGLTWTLGPNATGSKDFPSEVAIVNSFHGDLEGIEEESGITRPRARRRGRIFIGPLNDSCAEESAQNEVFVRLNARDAIANSSFQLMSNNDTVCRWVVYSPTAGQTYPVVGGWVNNAFDTQRRRGQKDEARTEWAEA